MLFASPAVNATGPKATRIDLFSFSTPQMRAFHITWMAFFVCFFAWFAAVSVLLLSYLVPLTCRFFGWWLQPASEHSWAIQFAGTALILVLYGLMILAFWRLL